MKRSKSLCNRRDILGVSRYYEAIISIALRVQGVDVEYETAAHFGASFARKSARKRATNARTRGAEEKGKKGALERWCLSVLVVTLTAVRSGTGGGDSVSIYTGAFQWWRDVKCSRVCERTIGYGAREESVKERREERERE